MGELLGVWFRGGSTYPRNEEGRHGLILVLAGNVQRRLVPVVVRLKLVLARHLHLLGPALPVLSGVILEVWIRTRIQEELGLRTALAGVSE